MPDIPNARRWPAIPILQLAAKGQAAGWNRMLHQALVSSDLNALARILYGLQAGMSDAEKDGTSTPEIRDLFIRLQKSIEDTAKKIIQAKHPTPLDGGKSGLRLSSSAKEWLAAKRVRDMELEAFFRAARF